MAENIICEVSEYKGWTLFSLGGCLDKTNAGEAGDRLNELVQQSSKLAVEMSGLEYISSAGIRILLRAGRQCKAEGKAYAICGAAGFVKEVIEDANLDVLVAMYPSEESLP
ncbi:MULTISPECIES: STAS domain-containing protein [unclassified Selenomonas]|jgi:anti-sigma B factor antagonist|uniref:STAS domain-containing protein n=1 Tax=unclassified Selenomonas TaxID=2637378 RepID=UPI0006896B58|nr:anti-sigma B factor antagonist [Selenomonas ruminantium]